MKHFRFTRSILFRLAAVVLLCNIVAAVESGTELYVYGVSYHTNREYGFNERNPGLGLGFYQEKDDGSHWYFTGQASVYYDSYENYAKVVTIGPRYVFGDVNSFHVDATLQVGGIMSGIDNNLYPAIIPSISVGYERYNLHLIYMPETRESHPGEGDNSSAVAAFLRIRLN